MALDTLQTISARYSCRAFADRMPGDADLRAIAHAGISAPSAMNQQPWHVIVLKNRQLMEELEEEGMKNLASQPDKSIYARIQSRGGKLYYNAPCMMLVLMREEALLDCGILTENIALAATSLGIDNLICGLAKFSFSGEKGADFKRRLHFPKGYDLSIAVLLGYAAKPGGKPHESEPQKITWIA